VVIVITVESAQQGWCAAEDGASPPPPADVARCDLLSQLGALLTPDHHPAEPHTSTVTESTPAAQLSCTRSARMDDSVPPRVDTTGTVPNNGSVDSSAVTSGMVSVTRE